ncbi:hypothetical protein CK203_099417 [Vitis vinifera]|uniref:DUF4283 domain-containing protein n=1 Tax=Vitis vinifera TaxID=29760 RepID=A0A438CGA7_VITVI|nr:hypothetical protein CK203_099417 [Vitis vinifera]
MLLCEFNKESGRVHDQGRLSVKGRTILLRKWSPKENMVVQGKNGEGNEGGKGTLKLVDLTRAKLWVEMLPNVVLPALLEVEDGEWNEWVRVGGCVSQSSKAAEGLRGSVRDIECYRKRRLPRARYRQSRSCLAVKGEIGGGWSRSGQAEAIFGPSMSPFKAHKRVASSTRRLRRSVQKMQGPARGFLWRRRPVGVGPKLRRNEALWYGSLVAKRRIEARKGKARVHMRMLRRRKRRQFQRRRGLPSSLQAPIDDRDIGAAVSLFSHGVRRRQVKAATGRGVWDGLSDGARNRVNPLSRCLLADTLSKEDTSASRVEQRRAIGTSGV